MRDDRQYWLAFAPVLACFRASIGLLSSQYWLAFTPVLACFHASIGLLSRQYWLAFTPVLARLWANMVWRIITATLQNIK